MTSAPVLKLTTRETAVLRLIAWGYSNKAIAVRLAISVKTVEAHKANGMRKLQMVDRSDVVRQAVRWGWLTAETSPEGADRAVIGEPLDGHTSALDASVPCDPEPSAHLETVNHHVQGVVMASAIAHWKFPAVCPTCNATAVFPVGTSSQILNVITVTLTCSECSHSWVQQAEQPPTLKPKVDRRRMTA